jgi:hypothetical protein
MLRGSRAKFSLPAATGTDEIWGIVMDWGVTTQKEQQPWSLSPTAPLVFT